MGKDRTEAYRRGLIEDGIPPEIVRHLPEMPPRPPLWPVILWAFSISAAWTGLGWLIYGWGSPWWWTVAQVALAVGITWRWSIWYVKRHYAKYPTPAEAVARMFESYAREQAEKARWN